MIWPVHLSNNAFQYFFQKPYWEKNAVIHEIKKNRYKALLLLWSDIISVSVSSLQTDLMFFICPYVSLAKWRSHASFIQSFIHLACLRVCTRTNICTSNNVKTPHFHWNVHKNRLLEKHLMSPFKILWYGCSIIAHNCHTRSKIHHRLFSTACLCYIQP